MQKVIAIFIQSKKKKITPQKICMLVPDSKFIIASIMTMASISESSFKLIFVISNDLIFQWPDIFI